MSAFVTQATRTDEEQTRLEQGQRHEGVENDQGDQGDGCDDTESTGMQKMLSAVSGSFLTSVLVTPLDVVRVRLQSQPYVSCVPSNGSSRAPASFSNLPPNLGVSSCCREVFWVNNNADFCVASGPPTTGQLDCAVEETQRRTFTSTLDGLRKIARNEGLPSLWRGLSPTLVMAVPANVIYFAGYDWLRYSKRSPLADRVSEAYAPLLAGSLARVSAATVISPIEMFRTRLQASSHGRSGSAHEGTSLFADTLKGLNEMVHQQGYASLWRGLTLTLWRDVPFSGLYWWGYEAMRNGLTDARGRNRGQTLEHAGMTSGTPKRRQSQVRESHTTTLVDSFIAGATSGAIAAVLTTPFDVGKTRQQVTQSDGARPAGGVVRPEERSMPRFLWHIFQQEGAAGLWRGWAARCLKVAPACAIMISSYEIGKKMARGVNEKGSDRGPS